MTVTPKAKMMLEKIMKTNPKLFKEWGGGGANAQAFSIPKSMEKCYLIFNLVEFNGRMVAKPTTCASPTLEGLARCMEKSGVEDLGHICDSVVGFQGQTQFQGKSQFQSRGSRKGGGGIVSLWGNVCPACARRATFLLTIPTSAPDLPSHGEAPQVDHIALHTFPTKHVA